MASSSRLLWARSNTQIALSSIQDFAMSFIPPSRHREAACLTAVSIYIPAQHILIIYLCAVHIGHHFPESFRRNCTDRHCEHLINTGGQHIEVASYAPRQSVEILRVKHHCSSAVRISISQDKHILRSAPLTQLSCSTPIRAATAARPA